MAITNVPSSITDPQLRQFLAQVKETLEVITGQRRGNPLDTPVSLRQLINYGLVLPSGGGYTAPGGEYDPMQDYSVPDAPNSVFIIGSMNYIQLEWAGGDQRNVSHTEIWRAPVNDQAQSVLIGTGQAVYADPVGPSSEFYYWLRFISYTGVPSPWHDLSGAHGQTADDPAQLLAILSERITESELYADLNSRINLIDEPGTGLVDSLSQEIATRLAEITALDGRVSVNESTLLVHDSDITQLQADIADASGDGSANAEAIEALDVRVTQTETDISAQSTQITQLQTELTSVQDDASANGSAISTLDTRVTANEGQLTSQANQLTLLQSGVDDAQSTADGNAVAISSLETRVTSTEGSITAQANDITQLQTSVDGNTAAIQTQASSINGLEARYTVKVDVNGHVAGYGLASTTNTYDGTVHSTMLFSVDTFAVGAPGATTLSFVIEDGKVVMDGASIKNASINTAQIGTIAVDRISGVTSSFLLSRIGTGNITNAYIGQVTQSDNYVPGSSGWRINKNGTAEFRSGYFRGDIYSTNAYVRGDVEASSIKANSANIISTLMLQGQAVTIPVSAYTSSTMTGTGFGNWFTVQQVSIQSSGAPILVFASFTHYGYQYGRFNVRLLRGGTVVYQIGGLKSSGSLDDNMPFCMAISNTPGSGFHTYYLQVYFQSNFPYVLNRSLALLETKR